MVSSYIIVNTFSILVAQRSRELALLRALGASKRQVIRSVQIEAFAVGLIGSALGLGFGVLVALGIRAFVQTFGLDMGSQSLILAPRTVVAAFATGIVVTMVAAWLPARRTGRIAPVQALRDDVALPESSVRRRLLLGVALILVGVPLALVGLFVGAVPHNGWWVGAGVLAVLLGVTSASPVIGRPFLRATGAAEARLFGPMGRLAGQNSLRNPRRTTATASALMIGLTLAVHGRHPRARRRSPRSTRRSRRTSSATTSSAAPSARGSRPPSPTGCPRSTASPRCCGSATASGCSTATRTTG